MQFFRGAFSALPTIRLRDITLRPLLMRDAKDMFEYARDPAVCRHVLWDAHKSIYQTRAYLRAARRQYSAGSPASFAIVYNQNNKMIGTIGFMWINTDHQSAEVGYSLSRAYWNKGLTTQALCAILDYGFDTLRLNRIEAQHDVDNPASGRVMQHAGMRYEGTLRQRIYNKSHYVDVALYAALKSDARPKTEKNDV